MWLVFQRVISSIFSLGGDSWSTAASSVAFFSFGLETEISGPNQQCVFLG